MAVCLATSLGANKMKRVTKILSLILIVVFALGVLAGCQLIGRDVAKYRSTNVLKIGDQDVTVGKLLDTFNSYYNNYYYYISAGYLTTDSLLEMVMNSLVQQYIQIDDYVHNHEPQTASLADKAHNAEYLSEEQFEYCIKYVKYTSFKAFDTTVLETLSAKFEIGDAKDEDTSRDFTEYETIEQSSYAEYLLHKEFTNEDADEYFEKYYDNSVSFAVSSLSKLTSDYIYQSQETAQTIIDELNDRIDSDDEEDKITFEDYKDAQQKAIKQYEDTVKNSYGISLQKFMENQIADMVSSCILALWSYEQYKDIDIAETVDTVNKTLAKSQAAKFEINDDFDSFITSLSNNSVIYSVPKDMQKQYVFVKNILIPFTSEQSAWLSAQSGSYGGTSTDAYIKLRNLTALDIAAEYFYSDKYDESIEELFASYLEPNSDEDSDSKYEKVEGIFKTVGNKIAINENGILGNFFKENGVVEAMADKSPADTVIELMKRFNTDTAQHSTRYDYVVYVGKDWKDYSHNWVEEFYTAVNELDRDSDDTFSESNIGRYAMCISTYGVHIIYIDSFVEQHVYNYQGLDWTQASTWNDTSTINYTRYKAEFDNQVSLLTKAKFEEIEANYLDGKISMNKYFKRFLKENGFTFDLDEYLDEIREELG